METATLFNIGVANTSGRIHPELASPAAESSPLFGRALAQAETTAGWAGEEGEQIGPNALASVLDLLRATLVVENPVSQTPPVTEGEANAPQGGFVLPTATTLTLAQPAQIAANAEVLAKVLGEQSPAGEKLRSILGLDRPAMTTGQIGFAGFELVDSTAQEVTPTDLSSGQSESRDFKLAGAVTALVLTFNGSKEQLAQQMRFGVPFAGNAPAENMPTSVVANGQVAAMTVSRGQVTTDNMPTGTVKADPAKDLATTATQAGEELPQMGAPAHVIKEWEKHRGMRRPGDSLAAIQAAGLNAGNAAPLNPKDAERLVKALEDVRDWVRQSSVTADPSSAATQPKSAWTLKDALLVKGGLRDLSPTPSAPATDTVSGVDSLALKTAPKADVPLTAETVNATGETKAQQADAKNKADDQAPVTVASRASQAETSESMEAVMDSATSRTLKVAEGKSSESANTLTVGSQAVVAPRSMDTVTEVIKARPQVDVNASVRDFADRVEAASLARASRNFTMTLHPPEAGTIEVAVKAAGQVLNIEVVASDNDVQTQLDRNRNEFVQAVEQKGMTVQTFSVSASQVNVNLGQSQQGTAQQQPNAQDFQQAANLNGTGQRREEAVPHSVPSRLITTQIDLTA